MARKLLTAAQSVSGTHSADGLCVAFVSSAAVVVLGIISTSHVYFLSVIVCAARGCMSKQRRDNVMCLISYGTYNQSLSVCVPVECLLQSWSSQRCQFLLLFLLFVLFGPLFRVSCRTRCILKIIALISPAFPGRLGKNGCRRDFIITHWAVCNVCICAFLHPLRRAFLC